MRGFVPLVLALIALPVVALAVVRAFSSRAGLKARIVYLATSVCAAWTSIWKTSNVVYFTDPNQRVHGWPLPWVIWQRKDADSAWLDYVGLITLLAYPLNMAIFVAVPSVVFLAYCNLKSRQKSAGTIPMP